MTHDKNVTLQRIFMSTAICHGGMLSASVVGEVKPRLDRLNTLTYYTLEVCFVSQSLVCFAQVFWTVSV